MGLRRLLSAAWIFPAAAGVVVTALVIRNLAGLSSSPPGLYVDEASIGYNAWAIARYGIDEHGVAMPVYFEAFGEYKNPVYIYVLSGFLHILPLTPAVVRLPAALFGLATCAALAGIAWRLSRSRWVTILTLLIAGLTPWLTLQSRVGFEAPSMVALLAVGLWCLVRAERNPVWFPVGGAALALSVYGYSTGRLQAGILAVAALGLYALHWRRYGWGWLLAWAAPVAMAYLYLYRWSQLHPGALVTRLNLISITADHPPLYPVTVERFVTGYVAETGFPFLFTHGDPNLRHSTGFGGMLLVTTFPLLAAGVHAALRRWREPFPVLCLIGVVAAPVGAAVTKDGLPHALRTSTMLPFLLVLMGYGLMEWGRVLADRKPALLAFLALILAEGATYNLDLFTAYPQRSAAWYDAGQLQSIAVGHRVAAGHTLFVSPELGDGVPYILVDFALLPAPGQDVTPAMRSVGARLLSYQAGGQQFTPGDVVVSLAGATAPPRGRLIHLEYPPGPNPNVYGQTLSPAVAVYLIQ